MAKRIRRRYRLPVLGRLTWAWLFFALAASVFSAYLMTAGRNIDSASRVALSIAPDLETLAPPATVSVLAAPEKTSETEGDPTAPNLRDFPPRANLAQRQMQDMPDGFDQLAAPEREETPDVAPAEIVITIDGEPAAAPGEKRKPLRPQPAAYVAPAAIPEPDPALLQDSPFGRIPKIGVDGRRASHYYARPFDANGDSKIAIIIGGLGLNPALTERAINELPPEITLAFAPYARDLEYWTARARQAGHEIMLELPMEARHGADALGPAALLTERTAQENLQRLDWLLSRFGGYFGVTNYLGAKFSADRDAMAPVLERIEALGLTYIDDTGAARQALSQARTATTVNRMIAGGADAADETRRDLAALEKIAARDGAALGKTYAYETTITVIGEWAEALSGDRLTLAPASAVLQARRTGG